MKFKAIIAALLLSGAVFQDLLATTAAAQDTTSPFSLIFDYTADVVGNAHGGLATGAGYLGYGYTGFAFSTDNAGWWKGGTFTLTLATTHGATPTESWLGDFQVADYINAGNHVYLQDFNLVQTFGNLELTIGQQDLCANYAACDPAGLYFNSSFGIHSVASMNMSVPIFPLFGLGLNAKYTFAERFYGEAAIYDTPLSFDDGNPFGFEYNLSPELGYIIANEWGYASRIGDLEGACKIGFIHQTGDNITTYHLTLWHDVWRRGERAITPFVIFSCSPSSQLKHDHMIAFGANMRGAFFSDGRDELGLAATMACIGNHSIDANHIHETAIELTYRYAVTDCLSLQPELQYIINPSGTDLDLDNAVFVGLRANIGL